MPHFMLAQALKLYGEAGDKAGVGELKKLVVEYNKKAEANFQTHEFSISIDDKTVNEMQKIIDSFTKADNLADNLERLSKSQIVVPALQPLRKMQKN